MMSNKQIADHSMIGGFTKYNFQNYCRMFNFKSQRSWRHLDFIDERTVWIHIYTVFSSLVHWKFHELNLQYFSIKTFSFNQCISPKKCLNLTLSATSGKPSRIYVKRQTYTIIFDNVLKRETLNERSKFFFLKASSSYLQVRNKEIGELWRKGSLEHTKNFLFKGLYSNEHGTIEGCLLTLPLFWMC